MITRVDAERTVARWATNRSHGLGYELTPMVHEFDLGFVIWTREPDGVMAEPGSGARTVIDRETGDMTHFPAHAADHVAELYAAQRAAPRPTSTLDRAAELRRQNDRGVTPTVAAHLTLAADGKLRRASGAKSDGEISHHRLVQEWLEAQPRGHVVRGAERHAELIVVSDALHELDAIAAREGRSPVDLETARQILIRRHIEAFHVRDVGDRTGGTRAEACTTCADAYEHLGVQPRSVIRRKYETKVETSHDPAPDPERFPPDVTPFLVRAGWTDQFLSDEGLAPAMISYVLHRRPSAVKHQSFPAAVEAVARYRGLHFYSHRPGVDHRVVPFFLDPTYEIGCAQALADFGAVIGLRLFPLGRDDDHAVLAIDEAGRVFALDQGGEWYLGDTIETALITLIRGTHQPRVKADGTW